MKKLLAISFLIIVTGCASNVVTEFPFSKYSEDRDAVEMHFACTELIGLTDKCNEGLYIDYEQVYEALGDFSLTKGGLKKETKYVLMIPEGKYLFSPYGKGRMNNGAYDKFLTISGKTCVIINPVDFELNIFAKITNNEGSWATIECSKFDEITQDFNNVIL